MQDRHFKHWPKGLSKQLTLPETSLYYNLEVSARRYPDKAFVVFYGSTLTFAEFKRQVDTLAGYLQQHCGVRKGDRVLLYMQNSPQFMLAYYAILRADAMVVPVNPMNMSAELAHYVSDSDAATALAGQELYAQIQPYLGKGLNHLIVAAYADYVTAPTDLKLPDAVAAPRKDLNGAGVVLWRDALASGAQPGAHTAGPDDLCVMPYTSGTTGQPKGCIHTHRTVMSTTIGGAAWFGTTTDATVLGTLPMFHATAMQGVLNSPIYTGATVVLMQRWDRELAAQLMQRYRVSSWTNIATMAIDFLANPKLGEYDISSLRLIGGGGAAMPQAVAQKLYDLTGLEYIEGYGLSETIAPTHINPPQRPLKQCLGIPIFDTDCRIINPDTLQEVAVGDVGEIVSHGPQVFKGYWKNPKATEEAFIEIEGKRFFRTGDLARMDEDGYFFMVDRLKRMINASGLKVWPAEVEAMMYAHPDIQEACVIAALDPYRGETVKAVLVLKAASKGKVSAEDVIEWCKAHMAAYKYPRIVEFVDSLPKSATGKVMWRALQEQETQKAQAKA